MPRSAATGRHMRMLAVAFGPSSMAEACTGLPRIREQADCIELRLDHFREPFDLSVLLRERGGLPVVATLRPTGQGGYSTLSTDERLKVLVQAAELGAEYVDLEWDAASTSAQSAVRHAGAKVIVSRHDFDAMPAGLDTDWLAQLSGLGADVVKLVGAARDVRQCLPVLNVLKQVDRPAIAIAMGEAGLITRVLALRSEHCLLTYAAPNDLAGTAPGQLTAREMRDTYRVERLGSSTRVYGLLGPHVETDRLAEYNAWFADDDFDGLAVPFVAHVDAAEIITTYRQLPVSGWHIHGADLQQDALSALDNLTSKAARQDKVNAVKAAPDGVLTGHWVESPREQYEFWTG